MVYRLTLAWPGRVYRLTQEGSGHHQRRLATGLDRQIVGPVDEGLPCQERWTSSRGAERTAAHASEDMSLMLIIGASSASDLGAL